MLNQPLKLSASGHDLGGRLLFGRCLGFSGTPSDLLPLELGRCAPASNRELSGGCGSGVAV
eukprot:2518679-Pyramimonas_sp.AAC.1